MMGERLRHKANHGRRKQTETPGEGITKGVGEAKGDSVTYWQRETAKSGKGKAKGDTVSGEKRKAEKLQG